MAQGKHPHSKREQQENRKDLNQSKTKIGQANTTLYSFTSSTRGSDVPYKGLGGHTPPALRVAVLLAILLGWLCSLLLLFSAEVLLPQHLQTP